MSVFARINKTLQHDAIQRSSHLDMLEIEFRLA